MPEIVKILSIKSNLFSDNKNYFPPQKKLFWENHIYFKKIRIILFNYYFWKIIFILV